jgi:DNA-3-methyladenine glycosylase
MKSQATRSGEKHCIKAIHPDRSARLRRARVDHGDSSGDSRRGVHSKQMRRVVKAKAFRSRRTVTIARGLLGKFLVRVTPSGTAAAMITEVEAYDGEHDRACHARNGRTARNVVMYAPGGIWYVYLCYGVHDMLNLVTGPRDYPAAVLIRGVDGASGPGRLTKRLEIDRRLNGEVCAPESGLWIEDRGMRVPRGAIKAAPRIGVDYAGRVWAKKRWRFVLTAPRALRSSRRP